MPRSSCTLDRVAEPPSALVIPVISGVGFTGLLRIGWHLLVT